MVVQEEGVPHLTTCLFKKSDANPQHTHTSLPDAPLCLGTGYWGQPETPIY